MLARCRVHEVSQEWGCEWGSSYMNESIHSVSSHDCRFLRSRMRCSSLVITQKCRCVRAARVSGGRRIGVSPASRRYPWDRVYDRGEPNSLSSL